MVEKRYRGPGVVKRLRGVVKRLRVAVKRLREVMKRLIGIGETVERNW